MGKRVARSDGVTPDAVQGGWGREANARRLAWRLQQKFQWFMRWQNRAMATWRTCEIFHKGNRSVKHSQCLVLGLGDERDWRVWVASHKLGLGAWLGNGAGSLRQEREEAVREFSAGCIHGFWETEQTASREGLELKREVRLQPRGTLKPGGWGGVHPGDLQRGQSESVPILRDGQRKHHLRCPYHRLDNRRLALSDLPETYFYLETYFGTWLSSVLLHSSVILCVCPAALKHLPSFQRLGFDRFHTWRIQIFFFAFSLHFLKLGCVASCHQAVFKQYNKWGAEPLFVLLSCASASLRELPSPTGQKGTWTRQNRPSWSTDVRMRNTYCLLHATEILQLLYNICSFYFYWSIPYIQWNV